MEADNSTFIEEVTWEEARGTIAATCTELTTIIDAISPSKKYPLLRISYPFGAKIFEKATFYLPNASGISIPISDSRIPQKIQDQLNYNSIPLGIIAQNHVEKFLEVDDKVFCTALHDSDLEIGIWEHFGWTTPYSATAGARSLYMLPKISEALSHKRLKKEFGITAPPPKRLSEHWQVFTQLANSKNFSEKWRCQIFFLPEKWVDKIKTDPAWSQLNFHLLQKGWSHCNCARSKSILDVIWKIFAQNVNSNSIKFDPYIINTLNHLFLIGIKALPASAPTINNNAAGPLKKIQSIYEDVYNLQNIPTIMQPKYFGFKDNAPIYYSLQNPTMLESLPKSKQSTSVIETIRNLKELIDYFFTKTPWITLEQPTQSLYEVIDKSNFSFFHSDAFAYGPHIRPSTEMPENDSALIYNPTKNPTKKFAHSSSFLRGCVRISHQQHAPNQP